MVIKSVVQALADEGRVDTDKVGNSTYYWAFKTKQSARLKDEQTKLEKDVSALSVQLKSLRDANDALKTEKQETEHTKELNAEYESLRL